MSYKELPDGTRVYDKGLRYKPLPPEQRKYKVRKPDDPSAVRWKGDWLLPLKLCAEGLRVMPETRPDEVLLEHWDSSVLCRCQVCTRPDEIMARWKRKWRVSRGLQG